MQKVKIISVTDFDGKKKDTHGRKCYKTTLSFVEGKIYACKLQREQYKHRK